MTTIDEIAARWAKATPGPWRVDVRDGAPTYGSPILRAGEEPVARFGWSATAHNAEAIAHAPADIAYLLQRVRELKTELTRLRRIEAAVWSAPVFVDGGTEAESLRKKYARELDRRTDQERMHWELGYDTAIIDLRKGIFP